MRVEQQKELPSSRHSGIFGTIASRDFDGDELGLREGRSGPGAAPSPAQFPGEVWGGA